MTDNERVYCTYIGKMQWSGAFFSLNLVTNMRKKKEESPFFSFFAIFENITLVPITWSKNKFLYGLIPSFCNLQINLFHPSALQLCVIIYYVAIFLLCISMPNFPPEYLGTGYLESVQQKIEVPTCCSYAKSW